MRVLINKADAEALFQKCKRALMELDKEGSAEDYSSIREMILCNTEQMLHLLPAEKEYIERDVLDDIRAEIEENYGNYDICEWFEDYDYEENNISEYQQVGKVSDILTIIDKYKVESEGKK